MNDKFYLTPKEILEKEFKIDARGYRMQEVDKYLDMVIRDYTEFLKVIKRLEDENYLIKRDLNKLKQEYNTLKIKKDAESSTENNDVSSVDVLKRISQLERTVYGKN